MTDQTYVLYTYEEIGSRLVCHAYTHDADGNGLTEQQATDAGLRLTAAASAAGTALGTMVLPAEAIPA